MKCSWIISIENHMNVNAFCDIWARVMFFKSQNCNLRTWKTSRVTIYHEIHSRSYQFFFYNILNKITKRTKRKRDRHASTHTQLCNGWLLNCSLVLFEPQFQQLRRKKTSLKLFWVLQLKQTKGFIHIESSVNWKRVQYRNPVLHAMTFLCFRLWPVRNEIFFKYR